MKIFLSLPNSLTSRQNKPEHVLQCSSKLAQAQIGDAGRRGLAENLSGIRQQASGRGLLYSGLRQAGESGARAQMGADVARQTAMANRQIEDQAFAAEQQALQNLLQKRQAESALDELYNAGIRQKAEQQANRPGFLGIF